MISAVIVGCASSGEHRAGHTPAYAPQAGPDITRVPPRRFDLAEVAPTGRPAVRVRLETPAQVEGGGYGLWGGVGRGMGLVVLGAAGGLWNPVLGGGVVILGLLTPAAGAAYEASVKRLSSVLADFDLPARLQAQLTERLAARHPGEEDAQTVIEVSIAGYGFLATDVDDAPALLACFTFAAELSVRHGDATVFTDQIFEEPFRRSLDLPPSRCASMPEWAEHDARLAREVLDESSHVITGVIARRLKVRR